MIIDPEGKLSYHLQMGERRKIFTENWRYDADTWLRMVSIHEEKQEIELARKKKGERISREEMNAPVTKRGDEDTLEDAIALPNGNHQQITLGRLNLPVPTVRIEKTSPQPSHPDRY